MIDLPPDPLAKFVAIYEALNSERGWWNNASCLKFAAMTAIACPGSAWDAAREIRRVADELRKRVSWFDQLRSDLRFIMSATLVFHEDDPGQFLNEVDRVKEALRAVNARRGGVYETMAILLLRGQAGNKPIAKSALDRFQAIYEEMKRHHWWLTGPDDFPVCALLVGSDGSPQEIGEDIERIYQALGRLGFSTGDPLQTAANILHLAGLAPDLAATRFHSLVEGFRRDGVSIWRSDYDEIAILTFLDQPAEEVIERVLSHRVAMESLRPKADRSLTFNLAAGIAFIELARLTREKKGILDAKSLMDMQTIINAQRAAAAAAAN